MRADEEVNIVRRESQCFEYLNHIIYLDALVVERYVGAISWRTAINEDVFAVARLDQVAGNGHPIFDECQLQEVDAYRHWSCRVQAILLSKSEVKLSRQQ